MTVLRLGCVLLLFLTACSPAAAPQPAALPTGAPPAAQLLRLVNEARAAGRLCGGQRFVPTHALSLNPQLNRAALRHSGDMRARGWGSHRGSDGFGVGQRVTREGYDWSHVGENIFWNLRRGPAPAEAMRFWLSSPAHCRNLMSPHYSEVGLARDGGYWTLVFARPARP